MSKLLELSAVVPNVEKRLNAPDEAASVSTYSGTQREIEKFRLVQWFDSRVDFFAVSRVGDKCLAKSAGIMFCNSGNLSHKRSTDCCCRGFLCLTVFRK